MKTLCPCGSNIDFDSCCEPIIIGEKNALTAEQLMRSRYSAYTFANVDYLMKSHHTKTRNIKDKKHIKRWAQSVKWIKLIIINKELGQENDLTGMVEFKAVYIEDGQINQIHEESLFEKENNKWTYKQGKHLT